MANDSPYYYIAFTTDEDEPLEVLANEDWGQPSEGAEEFFATPVIHERMYERIRRRRHNLFTDHIHERIYLSLVEKTDTKIVLKEETIFDDLKMYEGFEQWVKWDIMTDDPRSH